MIITGAITSEEKERVYRFVKKRYCNELFMVHTVPVNHRIVVEVTTTDGNVHKHNLKLHEGFYEEEPLPGNLELIVVERNFGQVKYRQ